MLWVARHRLGSQVGRTDLPASQNGGVRRLLLLSFIWGWSFLFIKVAVAGMTPVTVACARVSLGAAVLLGLLRAKGITLPRDRRLWGHFALVGLVGSALPFTMLAWGEERITTALTSVLNASTPLFTAVLAAVMLRDRLRPVQVGGLLVGLSGVGVAAGLGRGDVAGSSLGGSLAAVAAGLCYGFSFTWAKRHLMGVSPLVGATGQLLTAAVLLAPFAVVTSVAHGVELTPTRILAIVLLGVVGSGIAYVLSYRVIADLGATRASLVTYLIPVVAVAVGVVVLDERFQLRILAGGALIITGIVLVNRHRSARRPSVAVAATLVLALLAGCVGGESNGQGDRSTAPAPGPPACGSDRREPLDERYLVHVLPGASEPRYLTDPPTSGPHQPSVPLPGVTAAPLPRPLQVGLLESGTVLLQHGDLPPAQQRALEAVAVAGAGVVVAPNASLPAGAAVVATAWRTKMICRAVDPGRLRAFVREHRDQGPDDPATDDHGN